MFLKKIEIFFFLGGDGTGFSSYLLITKWLL
ncbi:hypothetical protein OVS_01715 [Mycoplasma ovis str. Michigan]|uniref:Uncharacterized protein n=1 Tax=Mycoplasma ovis str. Michigan TaxID=1415773 RepID=A0ABM5P1D0_9MOLU|nr:hypothetical protein OVS_01715 [Mycoplasma ovis str. Michigan]